jgi:BirA family biotin operon repressor/biotin-[acetyl-CoA-carboxylase] ligase
MRPHHTVADEASPQLGRPWRHLRSTDSSNERARELAIAGAPHGTLVTAEAQTAGRGRHGRTWVAPPGSALLCSLILREPPPLLSLSAGVAVCDAIGGSARVKWPNDVVVERPEGLAKLAGILVEGRPQERWAVLGIGVNVAVRVDELPPEVGVRAASLERPRSAVWPFLAALLAALAARLDQPDSVVLEAWRGRDALCGREVSWGGAVGESHALRGFAEGIDDDGRLLVRVGEAHELTALAAGEVHLTGVR